MRLWRRRRREPPGGEITIRVGGFERPVEATEVTEPAVAPAAPGPPELDLAQVPVIRYPDGEIPLPRRSRTGTLASAFGPPPGAATGEVWVTPPGYADTSRTLDPADRRRFFITGVLALVLTALALRLLGWTPIPGPSGEPFVPFVFAHYLVTVLVSKLSSDLSYFVLNPRRRDWRQLDDYLLNDVVPFARLGFPLVILQAYAYTQAWVPYPLLGLWLGPWAALALVLGNRWLVERAQDQRADSRGVVPSIRGRADT